MKDCGLTLSLSVKWDGFNLFSVLISELRQIMKVRSLHRA
jgi:hypothetical protein